MVKARLFAIKRDVPQAHKLLKALNRNHPGETWPRLILCEMLIREKLDEQAVDSLSKEIVALDLRQYQACQRLNRLREGMKKNG